MKKPQKNFFQSLFFPIQKRSFFFLMLILVVGAFLRLFHLEQTPPRLTVDEMSIGYNAYSILKTGKDEWGVFLPKAFQAFGDYKQPIYIYLTIPFIVLSDLSATAVRLPSALTGIVLIGLTFFFVKKNFGELPALFSAFVIALSPWAIQLSRMAFESNVALAFFVAGLITLQSLLQKYSHRFALITGVLFGMTCYTYIAFRLIIFALLIVLAIMSYRKKEWRKSVVALFIITIACVLPLGKNIVSGSGTARFSQISLFSDKGIAAQELEQRNFCFLVNQTVLPKICRVFFHQYPLLTSQFFQNYLAFFSLNFLFWQGDKSVYLNPPGFGEFWLILLPAFILGAIYFFKQKDSSNHLLQFIFLLTPLPSALVADPQIVRGSAVMFFLSIIVGLGMWKIFDTVKKTQFKVPLFAISSALLFVSAVHSFLNYHVVYANQHADSFSPFPPELSDVLAQREAQYQTIYFSNQHFSDAHIFFAFYQKIDPADYQRTVVRPVPDQFGFSHPIRLGKYFFGEKTLPEFVCSKEEKVLFIGNNQEVKQDQSLETLYDFSHVHPQVKLIDVDVYREKLKSQNVLSCE